MSGENPPAHENAEESSGGLPEIQSTELVNSPEATQPEPDAEFQKELTGYEKSTLKWTRVIVGINVLTCIFIGLQFYEMKSASSDTHALAVAAQTQAAKMSNMSDAASKIQEAADGMVTQEQRIADNSKNALMANSKQSKETLNATIDEYRLEHRAWMSLTQIQVVRLNKDGSSQMVQVTQVHAGERILLNVLVGNTGSTPAFDVKTGASAVAFTGNPAFQPSPPKGSPSIVQPNNGTFSTIDVGTISQIQANRFTSGSVYVYGRVDYKDAFGIPHWATFCRQLLNGGGQSVCSQNPDATDKNTEDNQR